MSHAPVVSPGLQPCLEWPPLLAPPAGPPPSFLQTSWEPDAVASWEMPADTKTELENREQVFPAGPVTTHSCPGSLLPGSSSVNPGLCWEGRGRSELKTPLCLFGPQDLVHPEDHGFLSPGHPCVLWAEPKAQITLTTVPPLSPVLFGKQPLLVAQREVSQASSSVGR